MPIPDLIAASNRLCAALADFQAGEPVTHVYNPLLYARTSYERYLTRFGTGKKRLVFLGMNPGPWGMAQTGIPFGNVRIVRDWLRIDEPIGKPEHEHPQRLVTGLACPRLEISGERLWGAIARHWKTPERFFEHAFVANYCPLLFLESTGRNRTPDKLSATERQVLYEACDAHLRSVVTILSPEWVIGIGHFAEQRAHEALAGTSVRVGRIPHPSPANPASNKGWDLLAAKELQALGICLSG